MKSFDEIPGSPSSGSVMSSNVVDDIEPFFMVTGLALLDVAAKTKIWLSLVNSISVLLPFSI